MRFITTAITVTAMGFLLAAGKRESETCDVTIRLFDRQSGKELAGLIQIIDEEGKTVIVEGCLAERG